MAFDGGPGDDPLCATQASLVEPRVAPAATISPDDIFRCLRQIPTKLDNKMDGSSLTTSIQQTIATSIEQALNGRIQQTIATSIEKALDGLLSLLCEIKSLKAHLDSSKEDAATLTSTLRTELCLMAEPIHTKLNTLQQRVTYDIIALNAHINDITTTPPHVANTVCQELEPSLCKYATNVSTKLSTSLETATNKPTPSVEDLNSSLGHVTKTLIPRLERKVLELASSVDARFTALASPSNLAALERGPLAPDHVDDDGDLFNIYHTEEVPRFARDTDIGSAIDHAVCGIEVAANCDR